MEMSGHERLTAIKAAAQACVIAERTDLLVNAIDQAWFNGQAAATTWLAKVVEAERSRSTEQMASTTTPRQATAHSSIFGGPTPAQSDALTTALKKRIESMYGKAG